MITNERLKEIINYHNHGTDEETWEQVSTEEIKKIFSDIVFACEELLALRQEVKDWREDAEQMFITLKRVANDSRKCTFCGRYDREHYVYCEYKLLKDKYEALVEKYKKI